MSSSSKEVTLGISTTLERVANVYVFPSSHEVCLLVSIQGGTPESLPPQFLEVHCNGSGVGDSRNTVIDNVSTDYLAFCDDDVVPNYGEILNAVDRMRRSSYDFFLGRIHDFEGNPRKGYCKSGKEVNYWNIGKVGTPEILINVESLRRCNVRFDSRFGAGSSNPVGDEMIFLADCLKAGLKGQHTSNVFGYHNAISSGVSNQVRLLPNRIKAGRRAFQGVRLPFFVLFVVKTTVKFLFASLSNFTRSHSHR